MARESSGAPKRAKVKASKNEPTKQEVQQAYTDLAAFLLSQYRKKQRTKNN